MKMLKKLLAVVLTGAMALTLLTACGGNAVTEKDIVDAMNDMAKATEEGVTFTPRAKERELAKAIAALSDEELKELEDKGVLERPYIPEYATHNAHMYYIKVKDLRVRTKLLAYLKERGILSVFHYVPLHSATAGKKFGRFHGEDVYTTKESERLCRLPMYYSLSLEEAAEVVKALKEFPEYETIEDR